MRNVSARPLGAALLIWCAAQVATGAAMAEPQSTLATLCARLCGGSWVLDTKGPKGEPMHVSYVYGYDLTRKLVHGIGTFEIDRKPAWRDEHFYMAADGPNKLNYVGVSPNVGMVAGSAVMTTDGFVANVATMGQPDSGVRIVHTFPDPQTFQFVIFFAKDGYSKGTDPISLKRVSATP